MHEYAWYPFLALVCGVIAIALYYAVLEWRCRRAMRHLTAMNRGKMDEPGWVKQPWQHGAGACAELATAQKARIDEFARKSVKPKVSNVVGLVKNTD